MLLVVRALVDDSLGHSKDLLSDHQGSRTLQVLAGCSQVRSVYTGLDLSFGPAREKAMLCCWTSAASGLGLHLHHTTYFSKGSGTPVEIIISTPFRIIGNRISSYFQIPSRLWLASSSCALLRNVDGPQLRGSFDDVRVHLVQVIHHVHQDVVRFCRAQRLNHSTMKLYRTAFRQVLGCVSGAQFNDLKDQMNHKHGAMYHILLHSQCGVWTTILLSAKSIRDAQRSITGSRT